MRRPLATLLLACLLPTGALAQDAGIRAPAPLPQVDPLPDIELLARVTAESVQFHEAPQVSVTFPGTAGRKNVWHAVRTNLPDPVEVGRVYENVEVDLVISTTLPAQVAQEAAQARSP